MDHINKLTIPTIIYSKENHDYLIEQIRSQSGKKLNDVHLKDFILEGPKDCNLDHGIYIFKKDSEIRYVGKASSRSFIERVPAHLDVRGNSWMNTMLRYLAGDKKPDHYLEESLYAIEHFELLFVVFKNDACTNENISEIERFLIDNTNCLNKKKRKK
jgi:hypothetical protein